MKKEVAELWVKALRSGKYKQGRSALCTVVADPENPKNKTKSYCCLGVLADIASKSTNNPGKWVRLPPMNEHGKLQQTAYFRDKDHKRAATGDKIDNKDIEAKTCSDGVLTVGLQEWSGIRTNSGWLAGEMYGNNLVSLNDVDNKSFEEIADIVEKGYAGL